MYVCMYLITYYANHLTFILPNPNNETNTLGSTICVYQIYILGGQQLNPFVDDIFAVANAREQRLRAPIVGHNPCGERDLFPLAILLVIAAAKSPPSPRRSAFVSTWSILSHIRKSNWWVHDFKIPYTTAPGYPNTYLHSRKEAHSSSVSLLSHISIVYKKYSINFYLNSDLLIIFKSYILYQS